MIKKRAQYKEPRSRDGDQAAAAMHRMSHEFDFSCLPDNEFIIGWYPVYSFLQVSLLNFIWSLFLKNGESYEEYIFQGAVKLISVVTPILNDESNTHSILSDN